MLTAVLAGNHYVYRFFASFRLQRIKVPGFVYVAISGMLTAVLVFLSLTANHVPTRSFDIIGIVNEPLAAGKNIEIHQFDMREISYNIPAELYPELEYIVREPLVVASSQLPAEKWGTVEQTKIYNVTPKTIESPKIAAVPKVAPKAEITPKEEAKPKAVVASNNQASSSATPITSARSNNPKIPEQNKNRLSQISARSVSANPSTAKPAPKPEVKSVPKVGLQHIIRNGESLWDLANSYGISFSKLMSYNQDVNPRKIRVGQKIFIPGAKDPLPPKKKGMILPLASVKYVTSGYGYRTHPLGGGGRFHKGVDIAARSGTIVRSVLDGKVAFSGWKPQMGYVVEIEHEGNLKTVYGHNRRLLVKAGQVINQGQSIAEVGSTGRSTAPHLHFEVWKNGKHQDPLNGYLPKTMNHK